ncbi:hypothetical protein PMPD1_1101 [Paramixta manurensis]|uniref:HTH luxR-type domain-containing protein n=1 Tax=Paramixta manurensis TaxID=2740817 RepID=A0A6M8UC70_9GAMM|nr:hypothetical protein PMPD1_1101 [Erwiniaceae bacterium PD-1]
MLHNIIVFSSNSFFCSGIKKLLQHHKRYKGDFYQYTSLDQFPANRTRHSNDLHIIEIKPLSFLDPVRHQPIRFLINPRDTIFISNTRKGSQSALLTKLFAGFGFTIINKNASCSEFIAGIERLGAKALTNTYQSTWYSQHLINYLFYNLSIRENQILRLIISGKTNQQISREIGISAKTVSTHRSNIYRKLNVNGISSFYRTVSFFYSAR